MEMKNNMAQTWRPSTCHGVGWRCVSVSTVRQPFRRLANSFQSISIIWSVSIHFVSCIKIAKLLRSRAGHFDLFRYKIEIAKIKPVRHPARYPHGCMRASHLWFPHLPGDLKGMINKFNIALGQMQRRLHTKWWTKKISRSCWISNHSALLCSAPGTCKAGFRIEINAKAQENRLTILK
jgi:hypothetical protein